MNDKTGYMSKTGWVEQNTGDCVGCEVISAHEVIGGLITNTAVGEG